jgi:6-phospho-beta-glucosidase
MKVVLIGAGVRSPLFVSVALKRAHRLSIDELVLLDVDEERVRIFGAICSALNDQAGSGVRLTGTTDARSALDGADHVVSSIRVGFESGRVADERIAIKHGVLGQETTGPGGFAMALRNVPEILRYAALLRDVSPKAWLFNFTNPAGLITQALRDAGFQRTVGICDSGNAAQRAIARRLSVPESECRAETYGLNHLSWTRRVWLDGGDVLDGLLRDPRFMAQTTQNMFEAELRELFGLWFNEYLYYWYYYERALASIGTDARTRGEEIVDLTRALMDQLRAVDLVKESPKAREIFYAYQDRRTATYMHYASPNAPTMEEADAFFAEDPDPGHVPNVDEGYAGVTFDVIEAIETGRHLCTAINVPNQGAIDGFPDDDVVEVSCDVDEHGVHPVRIGEVSALTAALMRSVKLYERLTIQAVLDQSRPDAIRALMAHPMVMSYSLARALVDDYAVAHNRYVPWLQTS